MEHSARSEEKTEKKNFVVQKTLSWQQQGLYRKPINFLWKYYQDGRIRERRPFDINIKY